MMMICASAHTLAAPEKSSFNNNVSDHQLGVNFHLHACGMLFSDDVSQNCCLPFRFSFSFP